MNWDDVKVGRFYRHRYTGRVVELVARVRCDDPDAHHPRVLLRNRMTGRRSTPTLDGFRNHYWPEQERTEQLPLDGVPEPQVPALGPPTRPRLPAAKPVSGMQRLVEYITSRGDVGSTCDEAVAALGMSHQSCSARCHDLIASGAAVDSGRKRRTRSGGKARVLVMVVTYAV